ncbi:histidinol-phosphatase HisJ family protein [Acetivibrio sp. MSJd-27]|uniref:histidinol-phosphatase HisJ family protein n=1 Tax=Acetivibrio sp. MSJd-27 TaxID=2841523 RepID=UPI0015B0A20D|nr:histidinol-phosphatase HisJ family protein [Acetivibrio sp. MSJd-27]MBU5451410.1 histidinol-phosphatase HisJ family protein [Acetivibrio sp. MSJd-27]
MYKTDYHVHTRHSSDARDTMRDMVSRAAELDIKELAFTDHIEINEGGLEFHYARLKAIYEDILQCREWFENKITIRFGLELGQGIYNPVEYQRVVNAFPFDFVMSSIHRARGQEDYCERHYEQKNVDEVLLEYVREIELYVDELDFDVFGHIDYPTRYLQKYGIHYEMEAYESYFISAFRKLAASGRGIELNISGLRDGRMAMPSFRLLKLYKQNGGEIVTLGSDSHQTQALGLKYEEGIRLLKEAGFSYLTTFENRKKKRIKI